MNRIERRQSLTKMAQSLSEEPMYMKHILDIGYNIEDPDFYLRRTGGAEEIGELSRETPHNPGSWFCIKIKEEHLDKIDKNYLYYYFQFLKMKGLWKQLSRGTTNLVSIRVEDIKNLPLRFM
jgi:hypothetical protein